MCWSQDGRTLFFVSFREAAVIPEDGQPGESSLEPASSIEDPERDANAHDHEPTRDEAYFPGPPGTPAVGQVELEETERAHLTAWGNEVDGLQVGLGFHAGQRPAYRHGESVLLVVRLRNVGQTRVHVPYVPTLLAESLPTITDSEGNAVPLGRLPTQERRHARHSTILSPNEELELTAITLVLRPANEQHAGPPDERQTIERATRRSVTLYGLGRFQIQYGDIDGRSALPGVCAFDPNLSQLVTGKLELNIEPALPAESDNPESLAALQGTWDCVSAGSDDDPLANGDLGSLALQFTFSGAEVTISYNDNELHRHQAVGTLVIDASKSPPWFQIDFHVSGIDATARLTGWPLIDRGVLRMSRPGGTFLVHHTFQSEPSVFEFKRHHADPAEGEGSDVLGRMGFGHDAPATVTKVDPVNSALQGVHDLCAERTRLRVHHREGHPRFAEIEREIAGIHGRALRELETVAMNAALKCCEEPIYGQPSYGIILDATCVDDIAANELLLFHADRVYRTSGTFRTLATVGEGWYFRPNVDIPNGSRFVVACVQDAPEEIENVRNGFMPNSVRARDPDRPYSTEIFGLDGQPLRLPSD
jgi:hypothetical protein